MAKQPIFERFPKSGRVYNLWRRTKNIDFGAPPTKDWLDPEITLPKLAKVVRPGCVLIYVGDILGKDYVDLDTFLPCKDQTFRSVSKYVKGKGNGLRWVLSYDRGHGKYYANMRFCRPKPKFIALSDDKFEIHFKAMAHFIKTMEENRQVAIDQDIMQQVIDAWKYHLKNRIPVHYQVVETESKSVDMCYEDKLLFKQNMYNALLTAKSKAHLASNINRVINHV